MKFIFLSKYKTGRDLLLKKSYLIIAGLVVILVIFIVSSIPAKKKPGTAVLQPVVLETREDKLPSEFPQDLPLEKNEKGFELTQSTVSLDYFTKAATYVVGFKTPWSKDDAAKQYEKYLKGNGYKKDFQKQSYGNTVFLQGFGDTEALSVAITEDRPAAPSGLSELSAADFAKTFPSTVHVAISFARP